MSELAEPRLTLKQQAFVEHITSPETFSNGTQAAIKAGYSGDYSTIRAIASENLTKPNVQLAIQKRLAPIMDADEVLEELTDVARAKPTKHGAYNGNHKLKALELVGKFHKLFHDKVEIDLSSELKNIMQKAGIEPQRAEELESDDAIPVLALPVADED